MLPIYFILRKHHVRQVKNRITSSPFKNNLSIVSYYHSRINLAIETIKHHHFASLPDSLIIENSKVFVEVLAQKKPILLCGLHQGLFELLHKVPWLELLKYDRPYAVLTAPAFSKMVTWYLNQGRTTINKQVISNKNPLALRRILKNQGILAAMFDQSPLRYNKQITLWDSLILPFNERLLKIFIENEGIILPISTIKTDSTQHIVKFHLPLHQSGNKIFQAEIWKKKISLFLEQEISKAPEQWNWSYPGIQIFEVK